MLNKLLRFSREMELFSSGDRVICAVSGGADSMALLFAMYLIGKENNISVECAHFNHHLRGEESQRDQDFVECFCKDYSIPFHLGQAQVRTGEKGLEAAAREARYGFLRSLPGVVATAHTADDNAETVIMHLLRGTGLKGLGGISPKTGNIVRPMLGITRQEVLSFLKEYSVSYVEDSSNFEDVFLRNRIRHKVMPSFCGENPKFSLNTSEMALRLREDEKVLSDFAEATGDIEKLRQMAPAIRTRSLAAFLTENGVIEPSSQHISLAESLVFSENPSASARFPGGVTISRRYDKLEKLSASSQPDSVFLPCPGSAVFGDYRITASFADKEKNTRFSFTVVPTGGMILRSRREGDTITFAYGSKSLKKLFIDQKIPAAQRNQIPVLADDIGLLGVCGYGPDYKRTQSDGPLVEISFSHLKPRNS